MKTLRSIKLTQQEFYEAVRRYVAEELNVDMPPDFDRIHMTELSEDELMLEWEEAPTPRSKGVRARKAA